MNNMPQWLTDLTTAQNKRDADLKWRHRSWELINRMHTTINDLRAEIKWLEDQRLAWSVERNAKPARPAPVHPDSTLGPVWFVSETDLDRIVAGNDPLFKEATHYGDYVFSVARLRSGGWGEVQSPRDARYEQITADHMPDVSVEDYVL